MRLANHGLGRWTEYRTQPGAGSHRGDSGRFNTTIGYGLLLIGVFCTCVGYAILRCHDWDRIRIVLLIGVPSVMSGCHPTGLGVGLTTRLIVLIAVSFLLLVGPFRREARAAWRVIPPSNAGGAHDRPLTSVMIRCLNEERHIGRLLTGICEQTPPPDQIVVVDSGSTDATLAIASRFPVESHDRAERFSFGRSLNIGCGPHRASPRVRERARLPAL